MTVDEKQYEYFECTRRELEAKFFHDLGILWGFSRLFSAFLLKSRGGRTCENAILLATYSKTLYGFCMLDGWSLESAKTASGRRGMFSSRPVSLESITSGFIPLSLKALWRYFLFL